MVNPRSQLDDTRDTPQRFVDLDNSRHLRHLIHHVFSRILWIIQLVKIVVLFQYIKLENLSAARDARLGGDYILKPTTTSRPCTDNASEDHWGDTESDSDTEFEETYVTAVVGEPKFSSCKSLKKANVLILTHCLIVNQYSIQ